MPEKILVKDENGNEVEKEYFTPEEIKQKEEAWKKELEESAHPSWEAFRKQKKMIDEKAARIEAMEKKGKTVNDNGDVVDIDQKISIEQIKEEARKEAMNALTSQRKQELLARYPEEKRAVVESYYNKLTTGEEVNINNMDNFFRDAELLADPNGQKSNNAMRYNASFGGNPPRDNGQRQGISAERLAQANKELGFNLK